MNIAMKLNFFGRKSKVDLLQIQDKLEEELEELRIKKIKLNRVIAEQEERCHAEGDVFDDGLADDEVEKLKKLKARRDDLKEQIKDVYSSLESIATILERREKTTTAKATRKYAAFGTIGTLAGIGLAYGSDTFATLVNKKTLDAVKTALVRLVPKI